jgi:hypothetical protein
MPQVRLEHFERAAADIGEHGDNDMLPFDIDTKFVKERQTELAKTAYAFFAQLQRDSEANSKNKVTSLTVFNERLLAPAGPTGFRVATKIQPFWNIYLNGLGVAIADVLEPERDASARSYRFLPGGGSELFNRSCSWRAFREATVEDATSSGPNAIVVQTDIASFYEHISHHHIENFIDDLFPSDGRICKQVTALVSKFSGGRSFGLPVGGQCSRILAELFMNAIDHRMTASRIRWHRYVDDYVLVADSNADAYKSLCTLSHNLADYGLTLNKTKTIMLTWKHYSDYVKTQLGGGDGEANKLRQIDLHFDPYSETMDADYDSLKQTVESLEVQKLLNRELDKALPDNFLVTQIARTLRLHKPKVALQLAATLLCERNLHAFRAAWTTLMRGVSALRGAESCDAISLELDDLLDAIPSHSNHLLQAEASLLHYLRTLRFRTTTIRAAFVQQTYGSTRFETVRRGCIECWRNWHDRGAFTHLRNRWDNLSPECQRLVWLCAPTFGDQGLGFRRQIEASLENAWRLGIERQDISSYAKIYREWANDPNAGL